MLLSLPLELMLLVLENLALPSLADALAVSPHLTAAIMAAAPSLVTKQPTLLHVAAARDHAALLQHLLAILPAATLDARRHTPLYRAAEAGALSSLRLLLARGTAEPERLFASESPLAVAARRGHLAAVSLLLQSSSAPAVGRALVAASGAGHTSVAALLLAHPASRAVLGSALCAAAAAGSHEIIALLRAAGAKPGAPDADGSTPLHHAARAAKADIAALLVAAPGVKVDAQDVHGWSPLHCAVFADATDVVGVLVAAGADRELLNDHGVPAGGWPQEEPVAAVETPVQTALPAAVDVPVDTPRVVEVAA